MLLLFYGAPYGYPVLWFIHSTNKPGSRRLLSPPLPRRSNLLSTYSASKKKELCLPLLGYSTST